MIRNASTWMAAALVGSAFATAGARGADWKSEHDAGWSAYKEGRIEEAERRLRAAEAEAQSFGETDPRLAATRDHLAWVLCSAGEGEEAERLAESALKMRFT